MNAKHFTTIGLTLAGGILAASLIAAGPDDAAETQVRIGTYDNRAIAIAYTSSAYLPMKEKMAELEKAKAAGDKARVEELEGWGEALQRKLHFQGFGRYPVDDLLANVADKLPALAEQHDLDAIVWVCDYHGDDAEVIDITKELAALFEPKGDRVWKWIETSGDQKPLDLDTLIALKTNH